LLNEKKQKIEELTQKITRIIMAGGAINDLNT